MCVGGGLRAKYLLPRCCIRDSHYFDMQYDRVLKKLNFDLLTPPPKSRGTDTRKVRKSRLICFIIFVPLSECEISVKILTTY